MKISSTEYIELYTALGPMQMARLRHSSMKELAPLTEHQQFVFLKRSLGFAKLIASSWYAPRYGAGYVVKLKVCAEFLSRYTVQSIAYEEHEEYKLPVCELRELNRHLVSGLGLVEVFFPKVKPLSYRVELNKTMPQAPHEIMSFC